MKTLSLQIVQDFVSLFFPRYCVACEGALVKGENLICTRCLLEMPKANYHNDDLNPFCVKLKSLIRIKRVLALYKFSKSSRVQHLLHALKYKNHPEIGVALGKIYGNDLKLSNLGSEFDLIVPVPLHKHRRRTRGYNQSEEFGKGLAEILGIECSDQILRRVIRTETQTRRTKLERWKNVNEGFEIVRPERIVNRRILLVDDVITTGATVEACANQLIRGGCRELSIGCIAAAQ